MGYAIAEAARDAGHRVTLISGPVALAPPERVSIIPITRADEMLAAVLRTVPGCDVFVMCAAVCDYRPRNVHPIKLKKTGQPVSLDLVPTPDILATVARPARTFLAIGFAAETNELVVNAQKKLADKGCDLIIANDVSRDDIGLESEENEVTVFFRDGEKKEIPRGTKRNIARELVNFFLEVHQKRLTKKS